MKRLVLFGTVLILDVQLYVVNTTKSTYDVHICTPLVSNTKLIYADETKAITTIHAGRNELE